VVTANIAGRLIERASALPSKTAIVEYRGRGARRITFAELAARVARTSAELREDGIGPGSRVLLFVPMSIELYVALLGAAHAGATAVFMDAWADRRRLDAAVAAARPDLFIGTPKAHLLRLVSRSIWRIPRYRIAGSRIPTLRRLGRRADPFEVCEVRPDAPALITFTTGSTGRPKAAVRSHGFLWAQHEALAAHLALAPDDVDMPTLPVFVLNNLALGITSVIPDFDARRPAEIDPDRILRQMGEERVTTSSGSPAFYERLARGCRSRGIRHLPIRLWTGGAPVYPPLASELHALTAGGAHVVYGSTEAEPIAGIGAGAMVESTRETGGDGGLCAGLPVDRVKLKIIRPWDGPVELSGDGWDGWEVEAGDTGEIVVTGSHVLGEYFDSPEDTRRNKIRDGARVWHRTGDGGRLDSAGRLWLMGRLADRVERDGNIWWSTPAEIRALRVEGVRHAAYLAVERPGGGERVALCVEADAAISRDLGGELRRVLAPAPVEEVHVLDRIPRDPRHASKTDTAALRVRLAGDPEAAR
jgi:acyl-CoA synthetase (AMP-forming)/AMP-acid ligase II